MEKIYILAKNSWVGQWLNHCREQKIIGAYQRYLRRDPDINELLHWKVMMRGNKLTAALLTSYEYMQQTIDRERALVDLQKFKMYILKNDVDVGQYIQEQKTYEPTVTQVLNDILKPGDVFLALGANIGYFSLLAATLAGSKGRVLAFEPNTRNLQLFFSSILENRFTNITIYPLAVADSRQILSMKSFCSNGFVESPSADQKSVQLVQAVRLDEFLPEETRVNVIKMDIEGSEPLALRSMKTIMQKYRPVIISEFNPWHIRRQCQINPEEYLQQLTSAGYRLAIIPPEGAVIPAANTNFVMDFWSRLNNDKAQIDLLAQPV